MMSLKRNFPKKKSKFPPNKGWGAANPNYVEDMMARGKAVRKPKTRPKTKPAIKLVTGKEAIKRFEKEISPKGMANTKKKQEDALKKLMEKRYRKKK